MVGKIIKVSDGRIALIVESHEVPHDHDLPHDFTHVIKAKFQTGPSSVVLINHTDETLNEYSFLENE